MSAKVKRVERLLRQAIEERLEEGYQLTADHWGVVPNGTWHVENEDVPGACAIGCYLLDKPRPEPSLQRLCLVEHLSTIYARVDPQQVNRSLKTEAAIVDASVGLGISFEEVEAIVDGFDKNGSNPDDDKLPWYRLGLVLRRDYYEIVSPPEGYRFIF